MPQLNQHTRIKSIPLSPSCSVILLLCICLWRLHVNAFSLNKIETGQSSVRCIGSRNCNHDPRSFLVRPIASALFSTPPQEEDEESAIDYDNEEILLKLHFSINDLIDRGTAFQRLSKYCQSFPFAAVLPVQPLQYLPTDDGGVDVRFLRKKTKEKGSLDGGIRFFLSNDAGGIDLVAKRNSRGQSVSKIFSEKLVVLAFIKRVTGEETDKTSPPPTDVVTLSSIFHKWM